MVSRGVFGLALAFALFLTGCVGLKKPTGGTNSDSMESCFAELTAELSAENMQGRGLGSDGLERAAALLETRFQEAGLTGGPQGYRQRFDAVVGVSIGQSNRLQLEEWTGKVGLDFSPLGFSSSGAFAGKVTFAGYGIQAKELGYDDYEGLDVNGRVVVAFRYEPGENDPESPFDGKRASRWSDLRYKAMRARENGAAALVLVSPDSGEGEPDKLPAFRTSGPTSRAGIPVIQVTREVANRLLSAEGLDLLTLQQSIEETMKPSSISLELELRGEVEVVATKAATDNIVGVLAGAGRLAKEVVVVGAHYDHLGMGGSSSLRPDEVAIHNGADDNASGVAAMWCGVNQLAQSPPESEAGRRTVVAVAFSAEEIGLAGSSWYVQHPLFPMDDTVAMVNLDMVGRVSEGTLQALGTDSAKEWEAILSTAGQAVDLKLTMGGDGYGPSDHTSFYGQDVPVVHFFSGSHTEYHTPQDDFEHIQVEGGAQVSRLVKETVRTLTTRADRLTLQKTRSAPLMAGDSRGNGAYLGTIPDYSTMGSSEGGVLLAGVRKDGPADRAGLTGGDILVGIAGMEIHNLYDMTFALRDHRPGDTVEIVLIRGEARLEVQATFGQRGKAVSLTDPHGTEPAWTPGAGKEASSMLLAEEVHLSDLRQLTFGGENAEGYFSPDGRSLVFQKIPAEGDCDQQFVMDLTTGETSLLSTGKGRTTCGYYGYPSGQELIYATTEGQSAQCPPPPDRSSGYVWPVYDSYELVRHAPGETPKVFLPAPGYDAEATVCMTDGRVLFTSTRAGDLDVYVADADGGNLTQLTHTPGYDGGAFFSPDCSGIVWRASRPEGAALKEYQDLLAQGLVRPQALEIFWMDADGSNVKQLTKNGAANFGPYPYPDNSAVVFSSNLGGDAREFDLYSVGIDGGEPERITHAPGFDGFPMFSPDGEWLVFASNRANAPGARDTNLFLARWRP